MNSVEVPGALSVGITYGIKESVVDQLIAELLPAMPTIRWIVFGVDADALSALDNIWRDSAHVTIVLMPSLQERFTPLVFDILAAEGIDPAGCVVIGPDLLELREAALNACRGFIDASSLSTKEIVRDVFRLARV